MHSTAAFATGQVAPKTRLPLSTSTLSDSVDRLAEESVGYVPSTVSTLQPHASSRDIGDQPRIVLQ